MRYPALPTVLVECAGPSIAALALEFIILTASRTFDSNMEKPYERELKDNPLTRILADRSRTSPDALLSCVPTLLPVSRSD
jgi:hypothetical protein